MGPADVYAAALGAVAAALEASSADEARRAAWLAVAGLDAFAARRVAALLVVEVACGRLGPGDREALRRLVERLRLEVAWLAPSARGVR